ncbi:hypothetical protein JTB14_016438 [Gonioctena quinquepunctata]|nr:hypothetical protein JTB14_016438 [Gonioctena quinquepunctata]
MQKGVEPDKDNWDIHELRIEGYSATLDGARKKAADSEYSTNEECQDAGRGRRIKIPPAWTQDHISGSSSDEETMTPPPTPKLKSTHGALLPDPQKGNSNNVEVVAEGGVRKKTVSGSFGKNEPSGIKWKTLNSIKVALIGVRLQHFSITKTKYSTRRTNK